MQGLLIALAALVAVNQACLPGYETLYNGHCARVQDSWEYSSEAHYATSKSVCEEEGADLVILRSKSDEDALADYSNKHLNGRCIFLALECDLATNRLKWSDGTSVDYRNFAGNDNSDHCTGETRYYLNPSKRKWQSFYELYISASICQEHDYSTDEQCGSFESIDTGDVDRCLDVARDEETHAQAQLNCQNQKADLVSIHSKGENHFIRRAALARGLVTKVHIGAQNMLGPNNFTWSDGTKRDFANFGPAQPNPALGHCASMNLVSTTGEWTSVECAQKMPYACTRAAVDAQPLLAPASCPLNNTFFVGDHVYSPNFPRGAIRGLHCDYIVTAPEGSTVQIEIVFFETTKGMDALKIVDGVSGTEIASITGSNHAGEKYSATGSNRLNLKWTPDEAVNIRGWHIVVQRI